MGVQVEGKLAVRLEASGRGCRACVGVQVEGKLAVRLEAGLRAWVQGVCGRAG